MKIAFLNPPGPRYLYRGTVCTYLSKARYVWKPKDFILLSSMIPKDVQTVFLDTAISRLDSDNAFAWIEREKPDALFLAMSSIVFTDDYRFLTALRHRFPALRIVVFGEVFLESVFVDKVRPVVNCVLFDPLRFPMADFVAGRDPVIEYYEKSSTKKITNSLETYLPRHELFDNTRYRWPFVKRFRYAAVYTQFGCPYSCSYCTEAVTQVTYRPYQNVMAELEAVYQQDYRELHMGDASFGYPRANTKELLNAMIVRKFGFRWSCYSHPSLCDEEMIKTMARAGCHTIVTGVDSADMNLLSNYRRSMSQNKLYEMVKTCHANGIQVCGDIMIGFKEDSVESCHQTIKFAIDLDLDYSSVNIVSPIMGSSIRSEMEKSALLNKDSTGFDTCGLQDVAGTPNLSKDQLLKLRSYAVRRFYLRPKYLFKRIASVRSLQELVIQMTEGAGVLQRLVQQSGFVYDRLPSALRG